MEPLKFKSCLSLNDSPKMILFLTRLWANNGDALSRQYAGTNALKGDFTRTGERNLSGMMKDGVNSASRCETLIFGLKLPQHFKRVVFCQICANCCFATSGSTEHPSFVKENQ